MFKRKKLLPEVPIYIMMGGVGENFGGVTSVALHRSSVFAELDDRPIGFLTTSANHAADPSGRARELKAEGRLAENVYIRNAWNDLASMPDDDLSALSSGVEDPESEVPNLLPYEDEAEAVRTNDEGKILQVDRFRADGSRFISDRRDARIPGVLGGRLVTAFRRDGSVAQQWTGTRFVYHAWLDWLTQGETSIFIVDSANVAVPMIEYRRSHAVVVHPLHTGHTVGSEPPGFTLSKSTYPKYSKLDSFDLVTALTESHASELRAEGIASDNLVSLSNMSASEPVKKIEPRRRTSGVMLARLADQKRIDHAIEAVGLANRESLDPITLDIYGEGELRPALESQISELNLDDHVRLKGYAPSAREKFGEASFSVLSSLYEGQGLVLLESMANGCIPISYDIRYGPSDVITHGVDGFLVPDGDVGQLAATIQRVALMDSAELMKMRKAAVKRSRAFLPRSITKLWGEVLKEALEAKQPVRTVRGTVEVVTCALKDESVEVRVDFKGNGSWPDWAKLVWTQRNGTGYGRVPARVHQDDGAYQISATLPLATFAPLENGTIDFWIDVKVEGNPLRMRIKKAGDRLPVREGRFELYATKHKSLSLRVINAGTV
ncbi:glycosyltransferase [Brevibacterium sp. CBA3109]|uniref:Glycosyltransferase n=1 Tax=Brevibacterium koreense TaxID=3140787 RepID=A0AAU7UJF9_9MICO